MSDTASVVEFATRVHEDDDAPKAERFRVLRPHPAIPHRWITVESFPTLKQANTFARGMALGFGYGRSADEYGYSA